MKSFSILMALLVAGSLSAQQRTNDVNARVILFGESVQTSGILLSQGVKDQANYQTGPGIRLMGYGATRPVFVLELGAGRPVFQLGPYGH